MDINYYSNLVGSNIPRVTIDFKDIRKSTIGETYEYLNKLIKGKSVQELENLNALIFSSSPLPLFEESIRLMLIDLLHLEDEVVKILLSQNDCQIKRILNCKWFFQNLPSEFCTEQIFPYISVSLRCKIINKLSKHLDDAIEAEKYVVFIKNNYSNERAHYLLPKCRPEFILNCFEEAKTTFEHCNGVRILLGISKRYPEVAIRLLSNIFDAKREYYHEFDKYKKVLQYLAGYHPDLIVAFLKKHYSKFPGETFGIKLTKKLGLRLKEHLFTDFLKNLIFKEKYLFLSLTFEEQVQFIATIVRVKKKKLSLDNWKRSYYRISNLLKLVPPGGRLRMIQSTFKEVYNLNYDDHWKCWNSDTLELLPTESRQPYVKKLETFFKAVTSEFAENVDDDSFSLDFPEKFIYLYDSSTAFEKFKEIIRKSPTVFERKNIVYYMVRNCSINGDTQTLQKVVEFVTKHHRNDDSSVTQHFVDTICQYFSESSLNCVIFEKLEDLIYFVLLKDHSRIRGYSLLWERHIYYRLKNNMNSNTHIKKFFGYVIVKSGYLQPFVQNLKSKHSKTFILALCDESVRWIRNKSSDKLCAASTTLLTNLLITCREYNKWNKHNPICLRDIPGLEEILKGRMKESFGSVGGENWSLDIWERYYDEVMNSYYKAKCFLYALKRNSDLIEEHLEGILNILFSESLRNYRAFFNFLMMAVSFSGKTEKVKEIILNEFKNGDSVNKQKNALKLYSRMCTIEEFSKVIESYLPKQETVEQRSDDGFDEIQISIPHIIKNIRPRWKNLQLILKFFYGDFLKSVLPSLRTCCYYTRCDLVIPFLKEQLDKGPPKVSYKKDIIRLIVELSDRKGKSEFYLNCWNESKHYSIRSILLANISKSFLEQPSQELFYILKKCILDCDDKIIESKIDLKKIPKEFFNDYVFVLWQFSKNQERYFSNSFQKTILGDFDRDNINLLLPEFCESIIKDNLFNSSSELNVDHFTILYLTAIPEAVEERVHMVLDLIKDRQPNSNLVSSFLSNLRGKSLEKPIDFAPAFTVILKNWPQYPDGILFQERILLTYYNLHQNILKSSADSNEIFSKLGKELKKLFLSLENLNELFVIYAEALNIFFKNFNTSDVILAIEALIADSQDRTIAVLAILSLPAEVVAWHKEKDEFFDENTIESKKKLNELVKTFESYNDKIVDIYLNSKFDFVKLPVAEKK